MRNIRRRSMLVLGLVMAQCALCASWAWPDTEVMLFGIPATTARVKQTWMFAPCGPVVRINRIPVPPATPLVYPWFLVVAPATQSTPPFATGPALGPGGTPVTGLPAGIPPLCPVGVPPGAAAPGAVFVGTGSVTPLGGGLFAIVAAPFVVPIAAGGSPTLGTAAAGDTSVVRDSVGITVGGSGTTVTISNFTGFMRNTVGQTAAFNMRNTLILAVYPSEAAANADENRTGAGASFFGKVELLKSRNADRMNISGGFNPTDFVRTSSADENSATPAPGLTKNVTVPSAASAVVVLLGDPRTGSLAGDALPGASPVGLALLSLLLAGIGLRLVSERHRRSMA
jgi:hypothetical protein